MLNDFTSRLAANGFAKPSMFVVEFTKVPRLLNVSGTVRHLITDLRFFCEAAELPGSQILYSENRQYGMPQKYGYGKLHDEMNLTFRLDAALNVKRFLDGWVNSIYNPNTGNVHYKQDYSGTVKITQIDAGGNSVYSIELESAFPVQIQPVSLGWEQAADYSRLPVTFSFKTYKEVRLENIFNTDINYGIETAAVSRDGKLYETARYSETTSQFNEILNNGISNTVPSFMRT